MSLKKFLTVILSATLLTIALSVGVFADTGGEAASVSSWAALQTAVNSAALLEAQRHTPGGVFSRCV